MKPIIKPLPLPIRINLFIALFFGLCAFVIVKSNAMVQIGNTGTYTDPREIFTILGSSLTGPWGGLIIGFFAGVGIPGGKWLASVLAHQIACVLVGIAYKKFIFPMGNPFFFFIKWTGMVLSYYYLLLAPGFVLLNALLYQENLSYLNIIEGILFEVLFSVFFPFIVLLILPDRYKQPLW